MALVIAAPVLWGVYYFADAQEYVETRPEIRRKPAPTIFTGQLHELEMRWILLELKISDRPGDNPDGVGIRRELEDRQFLPALSSDPKETEQLVAEMFPGMQVRALHSGAERVGTDGVVEFGYERGFTMLRDRIFGPVGQEPSGSRSSIPKPRAFRAHENVHVEIRVAESDERVLYECRSVTDSTRVYDLPSRAPQTPIRGAPHVEPIWVGRTRLPGMIRGGGDRPMTILLTSYIGRWDARNMFVPGRIELDKSYRVDASGRVSPDQ
jgi:hypothetical protein